MRTLSIPPLRMPARHPPPGPLVFPQQVDPSCKVCLLPDRGDGWLDRSGWDNDGSFKQGAAWVTGNRRPAVYFDGVNDYVGCGAASELNNTVPLTIAVRAWVVMSAGDLWYLINKGAPLNGGFEVQYNGTNSRLYLLTYRGANTKASYASLTASDFNAWRSIILAMDASNKGHIYLDGVDVTTSNQTHQPPTKTGDYNLVIGIASNLATSPIEGWIETVQIYTRSFTPADARQWHEQWR